MKRITLVTIAMLLGFILSAQEKEEISLFKKNEIKTNLPLTIFASFPEVTYERILQEDISVGASLGFSLENGDRYYQSFEFTPYCRWFFGGTQESAQKYAAGFFIELNGSAFSLSSDLKLEDENINSKLGLGLGVAVGWKYVTKNNWVGEVLWGGGRNFVNNGYPGYFRFGLSIGKRF